jgi:hypothetical protein
LYPDDHNKIESKWGRFFDQFFQTQDKTRSEVVQAIEEAKKKRSYTKILNHYDRPSRLKGLCRDVSNLELTSEAAQAAAQILHPDDHSEMESKWGRFFDQFFQSQDKTLSEVVQAIEEASGKRSYTEILNHSDRPSRLKVLCDLELTADATQVAVNILHPGETTSPDCARGRRMGIVDGLKTDLVHEYDLNQFSLRIEELFEWHNDPVTTSKYMAPYFAIVQSSGMGKTKLFTEYRKRTKASEGKICVKTILCVDARLQVTIEREFFDHRFVPQQDSSNIVDEVWDFLDSITEKDGPDNCVLLFDDAQGLMTPKGSHEGSNLGFRAIRWWLRMARKKRFVAVFAGT